MSYGGISVSAWARIEANAPIEYEVTTSEAEFTIGGDRNGDLLLVTTQGGLETLIATATEALTALRARAMAASA